MVCNCIDVSEWNKEIDWNEVKNAGINNVFIRAGFGQDYESQDDKYYYQNIEGALKVGLNVGVYFYSYATNKEMAIGEAVHCCRLIENYKDKIAFPVFYDIEEKSIESHISETVPAFIDYMNEHGFNAGVYCSVSWFDDYFKDIPCSYFWFASWGSNDGKPHTKPQWCDVWQYTSKGTVEGVGSDSVDCDIVFNYDMELLRDIPTVRTFKGTVTIREDEGKINIEVKED